MLDRNSGEPLYIQLKKQIMTAIKNGEIAIGDKLMSENEMLEYYGVGRMTIRAALAELVAEGCIKKEQGLGSFCIAYPRSKKINIDVLLDSDDTYFMPYVLKGISQVLEKNNCNLLLHDTKQSLSRIINSLEKILLKGTDGVLLQPLSCVRESSEKLSGLIDRYKQADIPIVVLFSKLPYDYCISLTVDNIYGAEIAAKYLLECGHRRLLGIFNERMLDARRRLEGFKNAIDQFQNAKAFTITSSNLYAEEIIRIIREEDITAIQSYNDQVAIECLRILVENGYRVPEDISLIGFDDTDLSINAIPRLTTLSHPKNHLGSEAARILLGIIHGDENKNQDVVYRPGLVIRQSVKQI